MPDDPSFSDARISPEWEFQALRALIKPQLKDAILHRPAGASARRRDEPNCLDRLRLAQQSALRLAFIPADGDFYFVAEIAHDDLASGPRLRCCSRDRCPVCG